LQNLSHVLISGPSQEQRLRPDQFETRVIWGKPAEEVLRLADLEKVDLLVMTTHGRSGIFHLLMGSITAAIFEHSHLPLLVLRSHHADQKFTQIGHSGPLLVTLDGTLKAETILGPAIELARRLELPITLLRVVSPFVPVDALSTWYLRNLDKEPGKLNKAAFAFLLSQTAQYLEAVQSKLCKQGVDCTCVVRVGDTAHEIRKYACESQVTALAMAAHSRGRFGQGWLGSVMGEIMQYTDQPLLLVNSANQVSNPVALRETTSVS
jgi:nucleotide-binding universal stress UspA family protein